MKRLLTYEEVMSLIEQEDQCRVNDCLQQIFCIESLVPGEHKLNTDYKVIGEFNEKGELGQYEVIALREQNELK